MVPLAIFCFIITHDLYDKHLTVTSRRRKFHLWAIIQIPAKVYSFTTTTTVAAAQEADIIFGAK